MSMHSTWMSFRSLTADQSVKNQKLKPGTLKRIASFAVPYKVLLAFFLITVVIDAFLIVATPLLLRRLIDEGVIPKNTELDNLLSKYSPNLKNEFLLQEVENRFTLFPIQIPKAYEMYKKAVATFGVVEDVQLGNDLSDWDNKLNENERSFIKNVLAFFAGSDGIVLENLAERFMKDIQHPEIRAFYGFQIAIENVHSEMYSLLIETYIKDPQEKDRLFNAIETIPCISKKAKWAQKWINDKVSSFPVRLIAFAIVEGIFFSGSFCSIFWMKSRGIMQGLCNANSLIFKDENLHCDFAIHLLNNHVENKPSEKRIREILLSALEIEKEFITESLPVSLIGMNSNLMKQYLEFVVDGLLVKFGCKKEFNVEQPFKFMEQIAVETKGNFFESRTVEYQKAKLNETISFEEDF